jgi:uncharacterized Ntn-hydrolase superfamily protein
MCPSLFTLTLEQMSEHKHPHYIVPTKPSHPFALPFTARKSTKPPMKNQLLPFLRWSLVVGLIAGAVETSVRAEEPPCQTPQSETDNPKVNTFSIVAHDPATGELGVAVQSKYFSVGTVVPWAEAGVGAVATQSYARIAYGPGGLREMRNGKSPAEAMEAIKKDDPKAALRQVGMIDAQGRTAVHTGAECNGWAGHREGKGFTVQGNLLAGEEVVTGMAKAFEEARASGQGALADWLMAALRAGQEAGGDKRGQQSAALLVVRKDGGPNGENDRFIDLRVEDHEKPIEELVRLLEIHKKFNARRHQR